MTSEIERVKELVEDMKNVKTGSNPEPILTNCKNCMKDLHDKCTRPETCLCSVDTEHGTKGKIVITKTTEDKKLKTMIDIFSVENNLKFDGEEKINDTCKILNKFWDFSNPYEILLYDGMRYSNDKAKRQINTWSQKIIPFCSKNNSNEVLFKMQVQNYVDLIEFDKDPNKLTLLSGILDITTMEEIPHTPLNLSKVLYPLKYSKPKFEIKDETIFEDIEKNLKDTEFYKYLVRSFTIDGKFKKVRLESTLENMARIFIKRAIDDKGFIHLGGGNNGKSVFLKYLQNLVGLENYVSIPLQTLGEDKFAKSSLEGISLNVYADLEEHALRHSGTAKNLFGGEPEMAQKKHGNAFTLRAFCAFVYSCNRFPKVYDQSEGFFRRWIINTWERDFENDPEKIEDLDKKLNNEEEKNKVFSSIVYLSAKINRDGKYTHVQNWRENQKQWNSNAEPLDSFISEYIIEDLDKSARKTKIETYKFYKNTMYDLEELPLSMKKFGSAMMEVYDEIKNDGVRYWLHIDLKKAKQILLPMKSKDDTKGSRINEDEDN